MLNLSPTLTYRCVLKTLFTVNISVIQRKLIPLYIILAPVLHYGETLYTDFISK